MNAAVSRIHFTGETRHQGVQASAGGVRAAGLRACSELALACRSDTGRQKMEEEAGLLEERGPRVRAGRRAPVTKTVTAAKTGC